MRNVAVTMKDSLEFCIDNLPWLVLQVIPERYGVAMGRCHWPRAEAKGKALGYYE